MSSLLIWLFLSTFQIKRLYFVCRAPASLFGCFHSKHTQSTEKLSCENKLFSTNSFSYSWPSYIEHIYSFSKTVKLTKLSFELKWQKPITNIWFRKWKENARILNDENCCLFYLFFILRAAHFLPVRFLSRSRHWRRVIRRDDIFSSSYFTP